MIIGNMIVFALFLTALLGGVGIAAIVGRWAADAHEDRIRSRLHDNDHEMIGGSPL